MTAENIKAGFRSAGLVPYDPQAGGALTIEDAQVLVTMKATSSQQSGAGSSGGGRQGVHQRHRGAVATAARLAIMYGPVKRLKRRRTKIPALSVIDVFVLWWSN